MNPLGQFARFFTVSLLGVCIDIGLAWLVHEVFGLALPLAALLGYIVAAVFNYVQHTRWTFAGARRSIKGFSAYLALLTLTAGLRVALVAWFAAVQALSSYPLVTLIAATAVTFLINFALSRTLIFRTGPHGQTHQDTQ